MIVYLTNFDRFMVKYLISLKRFVSVVGHVNHLEEPAKKLPLWTSDAKRKIGTFRFFTLKTIIKEETRLAGQDLLAAIVDRRRWQSSSYNPSDGS